ncbi:MULTISPECIES: lysozyme inhibitor LprI family protein [Nostoc]|uniref:Lysozyme inhibitor LprI family protein n=2 Tax=Nostoc TaxID=1177 RepID=A0ABR8I9E1_9NOSO|nr:MULTISPECIES: lysozyme inhibitor LprI family protein [Nostoc]MBD2559230.1 lysozyme inhibitor LprI family protein [Nostoc linckia FACHB-391]MBD2647381.1 lysozyme inhibitor LprI family protein [Nostoc foliaceum FACHB-393]
MRQFLLVLASILTLSSLDTPTMTIAGTTPNLSDMRLVQKLNCNNPQTQRAINECTKLSYQNADKKLNQVYQQLLPTLERSRKQKLIAAQQAWIKFRDTNCEFERSRYEGGSIAPTFFFGCLENTTKLRTQELQEYLKSDP